MILLQNVSDQRHCSAIPSIVIIVDASEASCSHLVFLLGSTELQTVADAVHMTKFCELVPSCSSLCKSGLAHSFLMQRIWSALFGKNSQAQTCWSCQRKESLQFSISPQEGVPSTTETTETITKQDASCFIGYPTMPHLISP